MFGISLNFSVNLQLSRINMGIFDFFKKKEEKKTEKIKFEELESWLEQKGKESKEKEITGIIEVLISKVINELKEEIKVIEKIDLNEKKAEERIKAIVKENLSNYYFYLSKLIDSISNVEKGNLEKLIENVNKIFFEFQQKSKISFEKATFLIGKELGDVNESIDKFFREMNEVLEENKELIQTSGIISSVRKKIEELKEAERLRLEARMGIKNIEEDIKKICEKSRLLKKGIEDIKNSKEYAGQEKEKEEARLKKGDIEKSVLELRSMIDIKSLAKTFHSDMKKMKIIKDYDENFSQIFEKETENSVAALLDDAKKQAIKDKIEDIKQKREEIYKLLNKEDYKLKDFALEIANLTAEANNLNSKKLKGGKRIEKFDEHIGTIKNSLKEKLAAINIKVY
jgi:hypothetical protein